MPKQTKLDEHAELYQPRKVQTEKEKLKDMSFQDKLSYLWEYYKIHATVTVVAVVLIIYIIHEIITPDIKTQFYAAIINSTIDSETLQEYSDAFAKQLELDPTTQSVELNDQFYLSTASETASSMQQVLTTYIAAGEIDVIIAPESDFKNYAYYGYVAKLSDELPTDVYSALTDSFYLTDTEEDSDKNAYGIYLDNSDLFKDLKYNSESYVLGIVPNYSHEDNTIEFIKYLFRNK
jgi:hypothetical protein